jgi:adenosine deaminase
VTINSDDPAYFGGYINENYLAMQKYLNLTKKEIYKLAENSFKSSFLDSKTKKKYIEKIKKYYEKNI